MSKRSTEERGHEVVRQWLEDLGYLVPMRYFTVQGDLGLDRLELSAVDFQTAALSRVMNTPAHRALAVKAWLEKGAPRKALSARRVHVAHQLRRAHGRLRRPGGGLRLDGTAHDWWPPSPA